MPLNMIMLDQRELLSPKMDVVFKALFGRDNCRDMLRSFINAMLDLDIVSEDDIEIANTEMQKSHHDDKGSRLDLRVRTKDKVHIDIEIQLEKATDMVKRSAFYLSKLYSEQIKESEPYSSIGRAIALNVLDYKLFEDDRWIRRARFRDTETNEEMTDCMELNFVELPKIPADIATIEKDLRLLWAAFIAAEDGEILKLLATKNDQIKKAVNELSIISADDNLRYIYDMRFKAKMDYMDSMYLAKQEGKIEVAKNLKGLGIQIDDIVRATGLSSDQIKKL